MGVDSGFVHVSRQKLDIRHQVFWGSARQLNCMKGCKIQDEIDNCFRVLILQGILGELLGIVMHSGLHTIFLIMLDHVCDLVDAYTVQITEKLPTDSDALVLIICPGSLANTLLTFASGFPCECRPQF